MIPVCKSLKNSIDLLGLFGKFYFHQQFSGGHVERIAKEFKATHIATQHIPEKVVVGLGQSRSNNASADSFLEPDQIFCRCVSLLTFRNYYGFSTQAE